MRKNFSGLDLALGLGFYIASIAHNFLVSLIQLDDFQLKRGFSKIRAFEYVKNPPKPP
jgi:hypothetical protein